MMDGIRQVIIELVLTVVQILRVLNESAVAVRTKAMKCLTAVVEADPGILARVRNHTQQYM